MDPRSSLNEEYESDGLCRILALDGGGAKGFYTLGVLKEIEAMLGWQRAKRGKYLVVPLLVLGRLR